MALHAYIDFSHLRILRGLRQKALQTYNLLIGSTPQLTVLDVIGINNGIIICIDKFLLRTISQFNTITNRFNCVKLRWVFHAVSRAVTDTGMQYNEDLIFFTS